MEKKKTRGDVFRINILPPSTTFPWVRIFLHEYGIRHGGKDVAGVDPKKWKSREEVAKEIGEEIIRNSKILTAWFKESEK